MKFFDELFLSLIVVMKMKKAVIKCIEKLKNYILVNSMVENFSRSRRIVGTVQSSGKVDCI
ncbi:hypothetical protein KSI01_14220 [Kurthia sibirica]|uniref:Uncharacterized protein n=1 Tax=Kurthia sibirica TaxID=202750 RepID=A0A2U3AP13_9BACL|nr:hypothetical protein DEX24_04935 [Kurthia sibirica]GEK33889.1 hypothetical protein KSI01_14220 [Kurthia sibirica]